jgi:hypothetical protein
LIKRDLCLARGLGADEGRSLRQFPGFVEGDASSDLRPRTDFK